MNNKLRACIAESQKRRVCGTYFTRLPLSRGRWGQPSRQKQNYTDAHCSRSSAESRYGHTGNGLG